MISARQKKGQARKMRQRFNRETRVQREGFEQAMQNAKSLLGRYGKARS